MFGSPKTKDLSPAELKAGLDENRILLIDVREPTEFAAERIAGALNVPLSSFNPETLPDAGSRTMVMQCAGGKRSAMAVDQCRKAGQVIETHLAGGLAAWKAAGLPTVAG